MKRSELRTEVGYQKAIKRAMAIFQAKEGTPEANELTLLLVLIKGYEDKHIKFPKVDSLEIL
jgi:HTH-type transcriptional regulator / antitoxin HigA